MKNKKISIRGILFFLVLSAMLWEVIGFITSQRSAELPKQLLISALLCRLVFMVFRRPQDDDDWAY